MVDAAEMLQRALKAGPDRCGVREVARDGQDALVGFGCSEVRRGAFQRSFVAASEDDASAFVEERGGDGTTDSAGGTGDEDYVVLELQVHGASLMPVPTKSGSFASLRISMFLVYDRSKCSGCLLAWARGRQLRHRRSILLLSLMGLRKTVGVGLQEG